MKIIYNVENFDTLESIASKFSVSVEEIKQHNNIGNDMPKIIEIPKPKANFKVIANLKREFLLKNNNDLNVCKSLNKLGLFCAVKNEDVCLFTPQKEYIYVVKVLDNLQSICNKFNLDKTLVMAFNNLKSEKLFIGQMLKLN